MQSIPKIDISRLVSDQVGKKEVARQIHDACVEFGFFYIAGHGIDEDLQKRLLQLSREFFNHQNEEKMRIRMSLGGKAWRGFFPVGDELTSGKPDLKEGLYFGTELNDDHQKVKEGLPLHGKNLFPDFVPDLKEVVLNYMNRVTNLGHHLMRGLSLSLNLDEDYFDSHYTNDPLCLFRIFHYPPSDRITESDPEWGVGEHTDYGVLTILKQDDVGGLQIKTKGEWIPAPVIPNTFICNIGDMLDRMTGGYYRSTPHRVINKSGRDRYSFPFFFDPNFFTEINPIPLQQLESIDDKSLERWDGINVHSFEGTYGDYILGKIGKVFPDLDRKVRQ